MTDFGVRVEGNVKMEKKIYPFNHEVTTFRKNGSPYPFFIGLYPIEDFEYLIVYKSDRSTGSFFKNDVLRIVEAAMEKV